MKKIFLTFLVFYTVSLSNIATAQDTVDWNVVDKLLPELEIVKLTPPQLTTGENNEKQVWLYKNSLTPFDGVLLNPEAAAFIIAEYKASFLRANVALEKQRASDLNRLRLETDGLKLILDSEKRQSQIQINGLQTEVSTLQNIHDDLIKNNKKTTRRARFKIIGGVIVGIATGILVGSFLL